MIPYFFKLHSEPVTIETFSYCQSIMKNLCSLLLIKDKKSKHRKSFTAYQNSFNTFLRISPIIKEQNIYEIIQKFPGKKKSTGWLVSRILSQVTQKTFANSLKINHSTNCRFKFCVLVCLLSNLFLKITLLMFSWIFYLYLFTKINVRHVMELFFAQAKFLFLFSVIDFSLYA